MANNYVRFQRGTQAAFLTLKESTQLDNNTLYFIENENGTSALYMGARTIIDGNDIGGGSIVTPSSLKNLEDVIINETGANSFLVRSADDKWVSTSLEDVISLIQSELKIDPAVAEDIANLQNSISGIEEDVKALESDIADKVNAKVFEEEIAKKANADEVSAELAKKADAAEVISVLAQKADAAEVNEELAKKANADEVQSALDTKADMSVVSDELVKKADAAEVYNALSLKANSAEVYTKSEVDNKVATDISVAIAAANHMKRAKIDSVEDINLYAADADQYIYMVPTGLQMDDDKYDEYMVIDGVVEKVGSWEVDLSDYAKKTDLDSKVSIDNLARLMTLVEGEKLAAIEEGAQVNIINSISNSFRIDIENNKQLVLNDLPISKITNLQAELDKKVNAQEGYTLLSPDDQKKLAALVIGEDNGLELSGTVNADNVQGLAAWLNKNANEVKGLSENNLTDELHEKLTNSMLITSVDISELSVSEGKLSIIEVDHSKITGLADALNTKANQTVVDTLAVSVDNISKSLSNYIARAEYEKDLAEIKDILTWQEMA